MIKVNDNFSKLPASYLFSEIARKVSHYQTAHPQAEIIRMGIGDVTLPLCPAAVSALHQAADEQASARSFHGYGPEQGYGFLTELIAEHDYRARGIEMAADEIFVSDGAKSDLGNIGDILAPDVRVAVTDPVYPVYVDTTVMSGRAGEHGPDGRWSRIEFLPCSEDNGFNPPLPVTRPDVIYLCYPNNPTGTVLTRSQLTRWVEYARQQGALILFDSAYEAYVTEPDIPRSIYEIPGAKSVAIEFRSFSKTAGFTGLRCGYTVVPSELCGVGADGSRVSLHQLWLRRQTTKFNGASYPVQRAAAAIYSPRGREQVAEAIAHYLHNTRMLLDGMAEAGLRCWGGVNSPYVWVKSPNGLDSWSFFDRMLERCHVVCTPGVGFGPMGQGYVRLTGFNSADNTLRAMERIGRTDWRQ